MKTKLLSISIFTVALIAIFMVSTGLSFANDSQNCECQKKSEKYYDKAKKELKTCKLSDAQEFNGVKFAKNTFVTFSKSGKLIAAKLVSNTTIGDQEFKAGQFVKFDESGNLITGKKTVKKETKKTTKKETKKTTKKETKKTTKKETKKEGKKTTKKETKKGGKKTAKKETKKGDK